ncbi:hypothetical protein [Paracoccus benzoatiresistens]|uniref:Uncharacterized protein n=1 Tax=Paracoccus benzoatiresistens TaxID=2997341 RepID=A0ABT4J9E8_9RHOB|nr:hypothetical protein [Paracoccus sp. EF6]MCZ0963715.1 hypothetical protein [Paracoccus sp. EF6]
MLVDIQARGDLLLCQHSAFSQPVIARAQIVLVDDIANVAGGEADVLTAGARGLSRGMPLLIEQFCDLGIDVIIEEPINQFHDAGCVLICSAADLGLRIVSVWSFHP